MTDEQQTPTQEEIKELHKKWVEALRSGEYKQTQSKLHNEEGFCCLGGSIVTGKQIGRAHV